MAVLATLAIALNGLRAASGRSAGREEGASRRLLRWPILLIETLLFIGLAVALWRPLPLQLADAARAAVLLLGAVLLFAGLALYLWGLRTLGEMFGAASSFGVRLQAQHRLVTSGPFAIVRHPMYLAVMIAFWGGLLLYRTWAMALYAPLMLGLLVRGRREERVLAEQFGEEWTAYTRRVPAWIPRLR